MEKIARFQRAKPRHLQRATAKDRIPDVQLAPNLQRQKIIAYQIHKGYTAPIRPARAERKWMDDAHRKNPYRCLPLVIANQYGWEILSTHHFRATWDGTSRPKGVRVKTLNGKGRLQCHSHFGEGVLTFQLPFLFKTPKGWNLMVRGPANNPKDGIIALDGIVETDWAASTFTVNWRFTRACTVEFVRGEPICLFFPIQRGVIDAFDGEVIMLQANPKLDRKFREWAASRDRFVLDLRTGVPEILEQGWQKEYVRTAKDKRLRVASFVLPTGLCRDCRDRRKVTGGGVGRAFRNA